MLLAERVGPVRAEVAAHAVELVAGTGEHERDLRLRAERLRAVEHAVADSRLRGHRERLVGLRAERIGRERELLRQFLARPRDEGDGELARRVRGRRAEPLARHRFDIPSRRSRPRARTASPHPREVRPACHRRPRTPLRRAPRAAERGRACRRQTRVLRERTRSATRPRRSRAPARGAGRRRGCAASTADGSISWYSAAHAFSSDTAPDAAPVLPTSAVASANASADSLRTPASLAARSSASFASAATPTPRMTA